MNDPTYVEAARKLAERVIARRQALTRSDCVLAFRLLLTRPPAATNTNTAVLAAELLSPAIAADEPASAAKLLEVGESHG